MSTDNLSAAAAVRAAPPAPSAAAATQARQASSQLAGGARDAKAPAAAATAPRAVTLRPPEKVDIGFDAKEMRRQLEEAVQQLNEQSRRNGRDLNFRVDEAVDRTVITVRSKHTGEVVRQIPSETVLKVAHSIEDMKGLLLNETV